MRRLRDDGRDDGGKDAAGTDDSGADAGGRDAAGTDDGEGRGRVRAFLGVVTDRVIETAPRIPVRELETLRRQFPGLGPEEIADRLVSAATKGSATVGAGVGAAAMMPVPPAMPAELAAELVGVASVELKLIAELHEVYGRRAPGTVSQRSAAYLTAWTTQRGINLTKPTTLNAALGGQLKRELRQQITKRTVRNLPNLAPFMVGAAVGAVMNSHDTARLARRVREDLRKTQVPWDALPARGIAAPGDPPDALPPAPS
ncbi:hypothetical protein DVA86_12930 [Streptomyces armeniacus]|uniref:EcsC family protein n=1 Tax=Streptomyces armeniacus TaxID=83291 RepID=A0A345Y085_9ACTN|nr:hypothetical protein DVA86_12930 [Streptomyces armeniacus]